MNTNSEHSASTRRSSTTPQTKRASLTESMHAKKTEELIDHLAFQVGQASAMSSQPEEGYWNNTSDAVYLAQARAARAASASYDDDDDDATAFFNSMAAAAAGGAHHQHRGSVCLESDGNYWDESANSIDTTWDYNEKRTSYLWKWSLREPETEEE